MEPARRPDPAFTYLQLVARELLARPELLAVARENVRRWLDAGAQARERLLAWDALLADAETGAAGMARLQHLLWAEDAESERMREFAPFAGMLSREQRRKARDLCGFRH